MRLIFSSLLLFLSFAACAAVGAAERKTEVAIVGEAFHINGQPTYTGRTWQGHKIEGLLLNSRMVQGIFDDLNPETVSKWAYPDTKKWDAERNTREFLAAMPEWRRHGLLAFTINLQGGSPQGYSKDQPWHNSAIAEDGSLRPEYMARLEQILDKADELGMVAILGIFYFGQDQRLTDEAAVERAVDDAVDWIFARGYKNVLIEVNNECNVRYDHAILQPERVHELIERVKGRTQGGRRLLAGTSYGGGTVPKENVVRASDFLLIHGNGVKEPQRIAQMVRQCREVPGYRPMPILFNEDDHFDFDKPDYNMKAAISEYASWGYFDFRMAGEGFDDGYQSVPVNWGISSPRKKAFFGKLKEVTGAGNVQPIKECRYFQMREGTWAGETTAKRFGADSVRAGTDRCTARFILSDRFFEITGVTDATGKSKEYRWIYRSGTKPGEFAYSYFDSFGTFDEGVAIFDSYSNSLTITRRHEGTTMETTSRFADSHRLELKATAQHGDGSIVFEGTAVMRREPDPIP